MKKALVCGAGGFIAGHLVERLKAEGFWVRGVDTKAPEFRTSTADEFVLADLRDPAECRRVLAGVAFDHVYQLAADMGGMEFIHSQELECLQNNVLINLHMADAAARAGVARYFYSSSVCIYRDMKFGEPMLYEEDAYPALPDNEYGWEKLYSEHLTKATGRRYGMTTRIARFENTYGPYGTWQGGREKAPAAICRKVASVPDGGTIEAFGDGSAVRIFTYVDDLVDGIRLLMESDEDRPTNIGSDEVVTVAQLISTVAAVAGKEINVRWIDGPVGVASRNFSHHAIAALGYKTRYALEDGITATYPWIEQQVMALHD